MMVKNTLSVLFMILNNQTKVPEWKDCKIQMASPKAVILRIVSYNIHSLKGSVVKKVKQVMHEVGESKF